MTRQEGEYQTEDVEVEIVCRHHVHLVVVGSKLRTQGKEEEGGPYIIKSILQPLASDHHQRIARSHHSIASFLLFSTNAAISSPQIPSGLLPSFNPSTCFLNSGKSKTTQFCNDSGSVGSHLVICALLGTRCGGIIERPRWRSSKMKATSVSSIGSRLNVKGAGLEPDSEQKESLRT